MKWAYPLATDSWDDQEYSAMQRVIGSKRFTMGPEVQAFEQEFAAFHGSRHAVMVNSGSSANLLMIAALFYRKTNPLKRGQEVIVPAVSWSTTYMPLQQYGLKCIFVDIDPYTLNLSPEAAADAVGPNTAAVLGVNLLGNPCDWDGLRRICDQHGLIALEDNCEALGAQIDNRYAGTFGLMGTFSFFFSHHISTMEGGMVLTDDEELYHILLSLRAHGWTRELPEQNFVCAKGDDPFRESFRFVLPGYNVRPLELSGAIGREQLKKLPWFVEQRRRNASSFLSKLRGHSGLRLQAEHGRSSWFGFSMIVEDSAIGRHRVASQLSEDGIETRPIVAGNFTTNEVLQYFDWRIAGDLKSAESVHEAGLFVGNRQDDLRGELDLLLESLSKVLD